MSENGANLKVSKIMFKIALCSNGNFFAEVLEYVQVEKLKRMGDWHFEL